MKKLMLYGQTRLTEDRQNSLSYLHDYYNVFNGHHRTL